MDAKTIALATFVLALATQELRAQVCATKGLIQPVGVGTPGSNGVPLLSTVGVPLQGKTFRFEMTSGLPGARGIALGDFLESALFLPQFGATLYPAGPLFLQGFVVNGDGGSPPLFAVPTVPNLCGLEFVAQAVVVDPAAQGGVGFSRAMRIRFGGPAPPLSFQAQSFPATNVPQSLAIADLDGDGVLDLVEVDSSADGILVLRGLGGGAFAAGQSFRVGDGPQHLVIADLNADGVPDVVVANNLSDDVSVLLGLGDGTFAQALGFPCGDLPGGLAIADLNGHGVPDVAVENELSGDVSVLLGLGDGTFAAAASVPVGSLPNAITLGDLNGDGVPDLVVALLFDDVAVLLGVGDGTFAAAQAFPDGPYPWSLAIADMNGDGVPDLVELNRAQNIFPATGDGSIVVLLGLGGGAFAAAQSFPAGNQAISMAIADLDGDAILDVAVANTSTDKASVLLGVGNGTLGAPLGFAVGDVPLAIATADLDGNGVHDLAVASNLTDDVVVLLNQLLD